MWGFFRELECSGHLFSEVGKKISGMYGLLKECGVTVEAVMVGCFCYGEAVNKLIASKTSLIDKDKTPKKALVMIMRGTMRCFQCRKQGQVAKDSCLKNLEKKIDKKSRRRILESALSMARLGTLPMNSRPMS